MSWIWTTPGGWLIRSVAGGGLLLLLTWVLIKRTRQPARRQRLGEWGVVAALLLAVLNLGPAWLPVSWLPATPAQSPRQHAGLRPAAKQPPLDSADKQQPPSPPLASETPRKERGASFAQLHSESPDSSFNSKEQSSPLEKIGMEDRASDIVNEELNNAAALPMSAPTSLTDPTPKSRSEIQPVSIGTIQDSKLGRTFSSSLSSEWIGSILCITYALAGTFLVGRWLLGYLALRRLLADARLAPLSVRRLFGEMAGQRLT